MRAPVRMMAAAVVAGGAMAVPAGTAHALSCVGPSTVLGDAAHVYAGIVEQVADDRCLFTVEEVWSGAPVGQQVWFTIPDDMAFWYPWVQAQQASRPGSPSQWDVAADDTEVVGPCSLWPCDTVADHRPNIVTEPTTDSSSSLQGVLPRRLGRLLPPSAARSVPQPWLPWPSLGAGGPEVGGRVSCCSSWCRRDRSSTRR